MQSFKELLEEAPELLHVPEVLPCFSFLSSDNSAPKLAWETTSKEKGRSQVVIRITVTTQKQNKHALRVRHGQPSSQQLPNFARANKNHSKSEGRFATHLWSVDLEGSFSFPSLLNSSLNFAKSISFIKLRTHDQPIIKLSRHKANRISVMVPGPSSMLLTDMFLAPRSSTVPFSFEEINVQDSTGRWCPRVIGLYHTHLVVWSWRCCRGWVGAWGLVLEEPLVWRGGLDNIC